MQVEYKLFRALHDETDKGWVWLVAGGFHSGDIIKLSSKGGAQRSVYCVYREIDANFLTRYNERKHTKKIDPEGSYVPDNYMKLKDRSKYTDLLVIGQWYRLALGIKDDAAHFSLCIDKPRYSYWAHIRAACQHPDGFVRLGARLGILGSWLGFSSLVFACLGLAPRQWLGFRCAASLSVVLALVFGAVCFAAGRGVDVTRQVI